MRLAVLSAILLSAAGAASPDDQLRQLVQSGSLLDLRWSDFARVQPDAARFYELNGYQFAWSRSGEPTPQALALIHAIENAATKGLDPEDYDASRWDGRVSHIGTDTEANRFDLALTVSAMRYISDVSSGKVNPKVFSFGLNFSERKCDLAGVLEELMNAADVGVGLDRLEPPFEGYWRTEKALARYLMFAISIPKIRCEWSTYYDWRGIFDRTTRWRIP